MHFRPTFFANVKHMTSEPERWPAGQLLRDARSLAGLSAKTAAERADMSESWWRKMERGHFKTNGQILPVQPTPEALRKAANVVGIPPRQLLEAAGHISDDSPLDTARHNEQAKQLIDQVPGELLPEVIGYLRGLIASWNR